MKFALVTVLVLVGITDARYVEEGRVKSYTTHGFLKNVAVPEGERIRRFEERIKESRIVGGVPAALGQYPFQAGLIIDIIGIQGNGVCGGTLVSPSRVVTAAHCWFDGTHQAWRFTVVLGSVMLFEGGSRIQTTAVAVHPSWSPLLIRNDVAMIFFATNVPITNFIAPIALPSDNELSEDFAGSAAIASGFGITSDDGSITPGQSLQHVSLNVITNGVCSIAFPLILQANNMCTSGVGGSSPCRGDSGGPLIVTRNNRPILIGVTSFGSALGCQSGMPAVFARVTSFIDFFNQHL